MRALASVTLVLVAGAFTATAAAQEQPVVRQYSTDPPVGTVTGVGTPTNPPSSGGTSSGGTAGVGTAGGGTTNGSSSNGDTSNGNTSGGNQLGAGSPLSPAAAQALATRVSLVQFGTATKRLRRDIQIALRQAGLNVLIRNASKVRLADFLASPLAKLLSTKGNEAVGQAFGAQLVNLTPIARRAFPALFGPEATVLPVIRAVLTRRDSLTDKQIAFQTGVTKGFASTGIPLAYVQRSDRKPPSLAKQYRKLGVLTVSNVDTPAGKLRLGKIMLGIIKSQKSVEALKIKPASQLTGTGGDSPGAVPWAILAVLGTGAALFVSTALRRRSRHGA